MKRKLLFLLIACVVIPWVLPLMLAAAFLFWDQYGEDSVYCWLSPVRSRFAIRLWLYYVPIVVLLLVNIGLVIAIAYNNRVHKLGLSKLALLWIPVSLVSVWAIPAINTAWASLTGGENGTVPFILIFLAGTILPSMGTWNSLLYIILLGRARKVVERTKRSTRGTSAYGEEDDAFAVDEVKLRLFGESITWFFAE